MAPHKRPQITIRPGTPDDREQIIALITSLMQMEGAQPQPKTVMRRMFADVMTRSDRMTFLVAECEGQIVGTLTMVFAYSTWSACPLVNIEDFFVREEYRRQGVGTALINEVKRIARKRGCRRADLYVLEHNAAAQRLYRKQGFEETEYRLYSADLGRPRRTGA